MRTCPTPAHPPRPARRRSGPAVHGRPALPVDKTRAAAWLTFMPRALPPGSRSLPLAHLLAARVAFDGGDASPLPLARAHAHRLHILGPVPQLLPLHCPPPTHSHSRLRLSLSLPLPAAQHPDAPTKPPLSPGAEAQLWYASGSGALDWLGIGLGWLGSCYAWLRSGCGWLLGRLLGLLLGQLLG